MEKNYYDHQIQRWMKEGKCGAEKASRINTIIDERAMEHLRVHDKETYWDIMRDIHQVCEGMHFNEDFAMWEVSQMHHTSPDGKVYKGEHWSIEEVSAVYNKCKAKLKPTDNVYDMYVALNAQFHDYCNQFKVWFGGEFEEKIIESAVSFFFMDEDYPTEGKVWQYFRCMHTPKTM